MKKSLSTGFSLVEVVIAIGVIGMMIVAVGLLLQRLPVSGREVRDQDLALKVARTELEELRALGFAALPANGPLANTLLASLPAGSAALAVSDVTDEMKQVVITVSWSGTGAVTRSVSLTSLITQDSGLP